MVLNLPLFTNKQGIMSIATRSEGYVEKMLWRTEQWRNYHGKNTCNNFHDLKHSYGDRTISLWTLNSHLTVHDVTVSVDAFLLFQRINKMKRAYNELSWKYEIRTGNQLKPHPTLKFFSRQEKAWQCRRFALPQSLEGRYKKHILLLHALSDCDVTAVIYQKKK